MTRRVIAVLIAVVFAAIGTGAVLLYVRSADARALEGKEIRTVLVAAKAIPAGTTGAALRDEGYVKEVSLPSETLPDDVMSAIAAADEALVTTVPLQQPQLLLRGMLGTAVSKGTGIAMPEGMLAVEARIPTQAFSPRSLVPGARVVVLYTFSPISPNKPDGVSGGGLNRAPDAIVITKTLFTDVEVIAVESEEPTDGEGPALPPTAESSNVLTVTLALSHRDAKQLATAVALGGVLNVALRNDASIVNDDGGVDNKGLFD
jgi:pilus assembly protein CpaB